MWENSAIESAYRVERALLESKVDPLLERNRAVDLAILKRQIMSGFQAGLRAANRQLLERHPLYDVCIVGGADSAIARAAYGRFEDAMRLLYLNRDHYLAWARPFYDAVRAEVAFVEGNLLHLWHGDTARRRYRGRNEELRRFQFDPFNDIAVDHNGVWRWNSDKHDMHDYVRNYFASRKEDG